MPGSGHSAGGDAPDGRKLSATAPTAGGRGPVGAFVSREATVNAVNGVTFRLRAGEVLCLLGESGSGKTVTLRALMRLLPTAARVAGRVEVDGQDVLALEGRRCVVPRRSVSMIFQEPMTALDPVYTIGQQIIETIPPHGAAARPQARARALELLELVKIPSAGAAAGRLSARAVGRAAAARDDRHRAVLRAASAAGGRADHRAGCDRADPGADPAAPAAAGAWHGHDLRHPRSGRGGGDRRPDRGDVCRADRRGGAGGGCAAPTRAPLHARVCSPPPCTTSRRSRTSTPFPAARPTCAACRRAARSRRVARWPCRRAAQAFPPTRCYPGRPAAWPAACGCRRRMLDHPTTRRPRMKASTCRNP